MATPASPPCQPPHLQQPVPPASLGRKVHFGTPEGQTQERSGAGEPSPSGVELKAAAAAVAASHPLHSSSYNELFSPASDDSWTIEAQRSGSKMEASPLSYTPASASFLESSRKADDLRGRLESLEAALKEMESKAVAHLDRSLQEKVLATAGKSGGAGCWAAGVHSRQAVNASSCTALPRLASPPCTHTPSHPPCLPASPTAAKIVQKRFLADKQLDKKLEQTILQTALKVVQRQTAAAQADGEAGNPTRKLEFVEQASPRMQPQAASWRAVVSNAAVPCLRCRPAVPNTRRFTWVPVAVQGAEAGGRGRAGVPQYVAQIEQGLGEVLRRLEKKVDSVASLLDQASAAGGRDERHVGKGRQAGPPPAPPPAF